MRQLKRAHQDVVSGGIVIILLGILVVVAKIHKFVAGSLILEMGALSRLTGDPRYEAAALRALRKLWSMRSSLNLVGSTLDVLSGNWIEYSSGIGAGTTSYASPLGVSLIPTSNL